MDGPGASCISGIPWNFMDILLGVMEDVKEKLDMSAYDCRFLRCILVGV